MVSKFLIIIFTLTTSSFSIGSTFFVPDSDSATLLEIAMIVSNDLKTTLRLLEVAKSSEQKLATLGFKTMPSQTPLVVIDTVQRCQSDL